MYDAWLMSSRPSSMLDARDAYLAADMMRFGGANQTELWHDFATARHGHGASSAGNDDDQPTPSFASPNEANATITFNVTAPNEGNAARRNAKVFVGRYEARVTPVADTDAGTALSATAKFVAGTYDFVVQAPGYGLYRLHPDIHRRPDGDGERRDADELGIGEQRCNGDAATARRGQPDRRHRGHAVGVDRPLPVAGKQVTVSSAAARTRSAACR